MHNDLKSDLDKRKCNVINNITILIIFLTQKTDKLRFRPPFFVQNFENQSSKVLWSGLMKPNLNVRGEIN